MSEFGVGLANACEAVFARHEANASHPNCKVNALRDLIVALRDAASDRDALITKADFEATLDRVVDDHKLRSSRKDLEKVFLDYYQILCRVDDEGYRASEDPKKDLSNPALLPGRMFLSPGLTKGQIRKMLAFNHVLAFPETLPLFRMFAAPGRPWPAVQTEIENTLVFARPMNAVNSAYIKDELLDFRMISRSTVDPTDLILDWIPEPAMAFYALESYLEITGHRLDQGCAFDDVERQLGFAIGSSADQFTGAWQARLRDTPFVRIEKGGAQVRVTLDDCLWLAERGMVHPITIARILHRRQENDVLDTLSRRVRRHLEKRMSRLETTPRNLAAYQAAFETDAAG